MSPAQPALPQGLVPSAGSCPREGDTEGPKVPSAARAAPRPRRPSPPPLPRPCREHLVLTLSQPELLLPRKTPALALSEAATPAFAPCSVLPTLLPVSPHRKPLRGRRVFTLQCPTRPLGAAAASRVPVVGRKAASPSAAHTAPSEPRGVSAPRLASRLLGEPLAVCGCPRCPWVPVSDPRPVCGSRRALCSLSHSCLSSRERRRRI